MPTEREKEFTTIYNSYAAQVLRICLAYAPDRVLAQDLAQETFIHVWKGLGSFRGEAKISTWIYRIAVNTCLAHIRSAKNIVHSSLENYSNKSADESHAPEQTQELYKAIHQLPEADRLLISMVLEEIPYAEIAASLNISEGNLRVKVHRVKQQLTKIFFKNEQL